MGHRQFWRWLALLCSPALILAACSRDSAKVVAGGGATTAPVPSPGVTTSVPALEGASTTAVSVPAGSTRALLRAVRADHHPGLDRVVFEFENAVPGYEVAYVARPVTEDGSGRTLEVEGGAVLRVRMEPASGADLAGDKVRQTYSGPTRLTPAGTTVASELVRTGDFEGVLSWAIGAATEQPFKVSVLATPPRLVVDLSAP